jgi:membrane protease YdiL (CAAX protease family)
MTSPRPHVLIWPGFLFVAWVLAWLLDLTLRSHLQWSSQTDTIYWIAMKAILWVLPVLIAIRLFEHADILDFLELSASRLRPGLTWGGGVAVALLAITYLGRTLPSGARPREVAFSLVFVNAVIVAPLVEEIALRGFFLKALERSGWLFWPANLLATLVFVVMHVPGWMFGGRFPSMLPLVQAMIPIAGLGLLFGWTKHRAGSLYAAILVHAANNLYSAFYP